jgi:hypothetical protein
MTGKEELLAEFDQVWSHPWESLEAILKDVSEKEAWYQHPIYSKEEREEGHPPSGTILCHLVHLGQCYRWYKSWIISRPDKPTEVLPPEARSLEEGIANVKICRDELRECISSLSEEQLIEKLYGGKTVVELARASVRHDAWHGGQIAVARRLYRMREK